ncbi:MAG: anthranilate phosphoribosyltransferase [Rhodospirillales bacterium]|nr:anthranilate phosphoribosyltransferase [Rhodospirillales bacterium]
MVDIKTLIGKAALAESLSEAEAERAFSIIMSGDATPAQMGGLLMALRVRGETVDEITGAAKAMRARMLSLEAPAGAIDTCGTGGDAKGTLNVSTASTFVVTACGVTVAKHGNRALSSKSGAADVLTALGVNVEADMNLVQRALSEVGTTFMMAPRHHSAVRHVGPTRVELGTRTLFNLLGPLCNPAMVRRQILGVFSAAWIEPLAETLRALGHEKAWVVHGADGLDEISTLGTTEVAALEKGQVNRFQVHPNDVGLPTACLEDILGGNAEENAAAIRALLDGAAGPFRDIVLMNAAAALVVADRAADLAEGVSMAGNAIDSGDAKGILADLVALTNSGA